MLKIESRGYESKFWRYASPVLALVLTGATSGLIFALMGRPPGLTVYTFLIAPLLQQDGFEALVVKAAPLIMMGVGLSLAYRANVWNIGTEGQFTLGAICGGGLALAFPDAPSYLIFPAMIVAGVVGGMLNGGLVAWLRIRFNANEILTSLMFAYITQYLLVYLVVGPWRDRQGFGFPQTALFSDDALAPRLIAGHQRPYRCPAGAADRRSPCGSCWKNLCSASSSASSARRPEPLALPASARIGWFGSRC